MVLTPSSVKRATDAAGDNIHGFTLGGDFVQGLAQVDENGNPILDSLALQVAYDVNKNPEFVGSALAGALTSAAAWRIFKITYDANQNPTSIQWADGNTQFDNVWDDHAILSYA